MYEKQTLRNSIDFSCFGIRVPVPFAVTFGALSKSVKTRSAAADVLRYFDIAAPLHHEDEELHVFPVLAGSADAALREAIAALRDDHVRMAERWTRARGVLLGWRDDPAPTPPDEPSRALLKAFSDAYDAHIATEEGLVYPAAQAAFDATGLARIGAEMQARRRAA